MEEKITNAQLLILEAAAQKDEWESTFQDHWSEYFKSKTSLCTAYKQIFNHIEQRVSSITGQKH